MTRSFDVAVMHDFYVDRLVHTRNLRRLLGELEKKASSGGGGMHDTVQSEVKGGNAVNLALGLARLGLRTLLLTHTDRVHEALLREPFEGLQVEIRAKPLPPALTVAFEERVNVMLGGGRGVANFGPELLDKQDWNSLASSKVVCSVNWAANRRGTALLVALRYNLGPQKLIYFDPADFRDREREFSELLNRVRENHLVDWMSINEEEASATAAMLEVKGRSIEKKCLAIGKELGVALDIHSANKSVTSVGDRAVSVSAKKVKVRRYTGAGDVWGAGSIFGRIKGMKDADRLEFANAAAGLYLEAAEPIPPTLDEVESALG